MSRGPKVSSPGISVIVPAYRSPGTLEKLCAEIDLHVAPLAEEIEIIFVDDGSGDGTWESIEKLVARRSDVRGISLLRNYGQHNALLAGIRASRLSLVLTIDDDLQNPPSQVPALLTTLTDDVDLVYGRPRQEPQGAARNIASRVTKRVMAGALGPEVYPSSSAFRLFRSELIVAADAVNDPYISIDVILSWATNRVTDVTVDFAERTDGKSGYTLRRLIRHALNMITGYSSQPLRWMSLFGLACASLGFIMLMYVLARFFVGDIEVAGFTFLAAAITLFSGVQLLSLGVLGEYVGRMHFRSMGKPPYVVRQVAEAREPGLGQ
ncbi:MAG: glycosyltransferase involved in cell wall biosynthesis [Minisyncoccia bacterium]|jgi:glycosyltransferase involved in cell wall biosynthesis